MQPHHDALPCTIGLPRAVRKCQQPVCASQMQRMRMLRCRPRCRRGGRRACGSCRHLELPQGMPKFGELVAVAVRQHPHARRIMSTCTWLIQPATLAQSFRGEDADECTTPQATCWRAVSTAHASPRPDARPSPRSTFGAGSARDRRRRGDESSAGTASLGGRSVGSRFAQVERVSVRPLSTCAQSALTAFGSIPA